MLTHQNMSSTLRPDAAPFLPASSTSLPDELSDAATCASRLGQTFYPDRLAEKSQGRRTTTRRPGPKRGDDHRGHCRAQKRNNNHMPEAKARDLVRSATSVLSAGPERRKNTETARVENCQRTRASCRKKKHTCTPDGGVRADGRVGDRRNDRLMMARKGGREALFLQRRNVGIQRSDDFESLHESADGGPDILKPALFPALTSISDDSGSRPPRDNRCSSVWTTPNVVAAIRAAPKQKEIFTVEPDPDENEDVSLLGATPSTAGLDILQPLRRKRAGMEHSPTLTGIASEIVSCPAVDESDDDMLDVGTSKETTKQAEKAPPDGTLRPGSAQRRGIGNIAKLRDRWWNALQKHNEKVQVQQQQVLLNHSESSSAEDSLSHEAVLKLASGTQGLDTERKHFPPCESICSDEHGIERVSIYETIRQGDVGALERLLRDGSTVSRMNMDGSDCCHGMSPLQLAVYLNRPQLVMLICRFLERKARDSSNKDSSASHFSFLEQGASDDPRPPLLLAAEYGREECLEILLSTLGLASLLSSRDSQGNTALHCCCRSGPAFSGTNTFVLLLDSAASSSSTGRTSTAFLFKLLSSRNNRQQTPLHVACEHDRADIVDCILTHRSTANSSLLSKIFDLTDVQNQTPLLAAVASGATDIVMSLLMWRGNNRGSKNGNPSLQHAAIQHCSSAALVSTATAKPGPCPLIWAVRSNNAEMVSLLLEFNDPLLGSSGYSLNDALYYAVGKKGLRVDIICILVDAGANPCATREDSRQSDILPQNLSMADSANRTATALAASERDPVRLAALLDTQREYLERIRCRRRRDPKVQKQPESFFANMEASEDAERREAMRDALVVSLFNFWTSLCADFETSSSFAKCALALYRRGASLTEADTESLKQSFTDKKLTRLDTNGSRFAQPPQYDSYYLRRIPYCKKKSEKLHALQYYSQLMLELPWCDGSSPRVQCSWLRQVKTVGTRQVEANAFDPDVVLVCNDGGRFLVHKDVVSCSSDKLAAAIRFAEMSRRKTAGKPCSRSPVFKLEIDISTQSCRWLLEHIYHGSIACGLPKDSGECCHELLELLLIAEEFICKSLAQECEMRLLSSADTCDMCFCSYCNAKSGTIVTAQGDREAVECSFRVCGPSMIDAQSSLNVLAVAQHVSESFSQSDYTVRISRSGSQLPHACSPVRQLDCIICQPLKALREVAVQIILSEFHNVVQSPAFGIHFGDQASCDNTDFQHGQEALLRSCIEDLHDFCLSTPRKPVCGLPQVVGGYQGC